MKSPDLSLARIASGPHPVKPPLRAEMGSVSLILRNGAPLMVVPPGKTYRRLVGGLPAFGELKQVAITTEEIRVSSVVHDISLAGTFPLKAVNLKVGIALSARDGYDGLMRYVAARGANFAELLNDDVRAELDQMVRERVSGYTADSVAERRAGLQREDYLGCDMLGGLFEITAVALAEPVHVDEYLEFKKATLTNVVELQQVTLDGQVTEATKLEQLRQIPTDARLQELEDLLAEAKAARRGLTLGEAENPALIEGREQRAHEKELALISQLDELRRAGGGDLVDRVVRGGVAETLAPGGAEASRGPAPSESPRDLGMLFSDPRLMDAWKTSALPGRPLGIATAGGHVIAVLAEQIGRATVREITGKLNDAAGAERTFVVDGVTSYDELVERYLRARVPLLAASLRSAQVVLEGRHLQLQLVPVGDEPLRPLLKELNDPSSSVLAPLTEVIPVDTVEISAASRP